MSGNDSSHNQVDPAADGGQGSPANSSEFNTEGRLNEGDAGSQAITSDARRRLRAILEPADSPAAPAPEPGAAPLRQEAADRQDLQVTGANSRKPAPLEQTSSPPEARQPAPQQGEARIGGEDSQPAPPAQTGTVRDTRQLGQMIDESAQAHRKAQLRAILMQSYAEQQRLTVEMQREIFGSESEDETPAPEGGKVAAESPRPRSKLLETKSNDVFPPVVLGTVLLAGSLATGLGLWLFLHPSGQKITTAAQTASAPAATVSDLVKSADAAFQKKNYSEALFDLDNALKADGKNTDLLSRRGKVETMLKERDRAIADYSAAIALGSRGSAVLIDRAYNFYQLSKYKEACQDYNKILASSPDDCDALFGRALSCRQLGQDDKAQADLERLVSLKPDYYAADIELGNLCFNRGDYRQAIKKYTQALAISPQYADGYYLRAAALVKSGNPKEALKDYNAAIRLAPDNPDYYNDRGYAYLRLAKFKEANSDFQDALSRNPEHKLAKENLSAAQRKVE